MAQIAEAYQLKITLTDSEPEVWRRVLVPAQISLAELHLVVQKVMGWENQHEYRFRLGMAGELLCDLDAGLSESAAALAGRPLYYTYDFKSGWLHRIEVEEASETDQDLPVCLPICLAGAAACPPENTGGVWGFDELMARLEDTDDPEYLDLLDKYGDFDPEAFDLAATNARLR